MTTLMGAFFWASAVALAAPLFWAVVGEIFAERSGVFTVGLEGLMLASAFVAAAASALTGNAFIGVAIAVAVAALLGGLYGIAVVLFRADQVVVGIGFNLVVLGVTSLLRRQLFPSGMPAVDGWLTRRHALPILSDIPWIGQVLFQQSAFVYGGYVLLIGAMYVLYRTRFGLVARAVGDGAEASVAIGLRVLRARMRAMVLNGALAGVGGAALVLSNAGGVFVDNLVNGRGFLVLALAMFARWRPGWAAVGALLFGAADALQFLAQASFGEQIPTAFFLAAPYVLALLAWAIMGRRSEVPSDLGKPLLS